MQVTVEDRSGGAARTDAARGVPAAWAQRWRPWLDWFGAGRLIGAALTILAVVVGGWWLFRPADQPTEAGLPYATPPSSTGDAAGAAPGTSATSTTPSVLVVHVAGAVAAPGVYQLPAGTRVDGAVAVAGGPTSDADPSLLNLAAPVVDGERVYVPRAGESIPPPPARPVAAADAATPAGPVDLNRATVSELDTLPGVGPATAQAIVDHREQHGPFATVEDLEAVRGIGPAKLEAMRDLVAL
jgi:competence protein ComEA